MQLIQGNDGTFYGTTYSGGSPSGNSDTVFSVTSTGIYTVLYSFTGVGNDGVNLEGSLILGSDGNFYGVTANGGTNDNGTVFKLSLTGGAGTLQFATLSINATET